MTVRVLLLDDHEVVRRGLRDLLSSEPDLEVVGDAATGEELLELIPASRPDVVLVDVQLAHGSGIEVCRVIRDRHPEVGCLVLTSFADDEALERAVLAGASGFLLKQIRGAALVDAVRRVAAGESLIDPEVVRRSAERARARDDDEARLSTLTDRERRILDLLAHGRSNREIATEMFLAEKTVKNYVSNLLSKMGMSRRTEAAVYAARLAERRLAERRRVEAAGRLAAGRPRPAGEGSA
ncbi:MAG TPA: response regulator transcription factor [Microthrixaceae bacterium]|nr:response regulator transcription factor [Microthrixaceae bacterium]